MTLSENPERKLNVVLDTNVIISAVLSRESPPANIFKLLLSDKIQNFATEEILGEIRGVLGRDAIAKYASVEFRDFALAAFEQKSAFVQPKYLPKVVPEDPDDDKFFHCALTANADFLISGDKNVLKIKELQKIKVVSPRDFLTHHSQP